MELKELQKLEGHKDSVLSLSWNPVTGVGQVPPVFSSCSDDETVRIWQLNPSTRSWDCKAVLEEVHNGPVHSCAWAANGTGLAAACYACIVIWDREGGGYSHSATICAEDEYEVNSACWSTSGYFFASCGGDEVCLWVGTLGNDFEDLEELEGHSKDVRMVQWHPTLDVLFSCSSDSTVKVWWAETEEDSWTCVQTLDESSNGHSSTVWAFSFNAEGDKMVTCSDDLTLKIWQADIKRMQSGHGYAPWNHICTLSGYHDRPIFSVHWSREGIIASGAADGAIRLFVESKDGLMTGPSYQLLLKKDKAHDKDVNSVQWIPGEKRLLASASDDGTIKIWELTEST
ncbi:hypothetical protein SLEP1_g46787 [Rubroshorea leprosula]|uniref:Cytosolic iron-sulfur protein assembly protein CIAO1 homolog n=1 Tax=Rubroshorea leprosula TaxID=152421 RepID=A0AAV5LQG2_9ROSI|nr:hypothetical protein SLEP1_g46787 [Rubroshorea leprosula]